MSAGVRRLGVVAACIGWAVACGAGGDTTTGSGHGGENSVVAVLDGDTFDVQLDGGVERVRMIGINAAEQGECQADAAADRLAELVDGKSVRMESDVRDRDDFGRLLRYVWVRDVFVNEQLVAEGLAIARRYPPDVARAEELEAAQDEARAAGLGLWADDACGPPSTGSDLLRIGEIQPDPPGDDTEQLIDEWIEIDNRGDGDIDLTGWSVRDESARNRYEFPDGFSIEAGERVRLRTGCGDDTETDVHWCARGAAIWNNDGDTVFLIDPAGNIVDSRSY